MTQTSGGCLCGAVRYTIDSEPMITVVCHCTHCQKQSGSVFSTNIAVSNDTYHQTGKTTVFEDTGDSGKKVFRHFCGTCGSPIISVVEAMPGFTLIKAGTLDGLNSIVPTMEVYTDHAVPWVAEVAGARRFQHAAG